jgi:NhaA family Na+:H+ antiporter
MFATAVALIWANSPVAGSYEALWDAELGIELGSFELRETLGHWVNDARMAIFFFVVGLEIKRELVVGELNEWRKAALPAIAAVGGMVFPALIYTAFNFGGPGGAGWGIPMATDIAFAVGFLALFGSRAPTGLKIFILSLAIVDDIGAILVIAVFYSGGLQFAWLGAAGALLALVVVMRRLHIWWVPAYVIVGTGVWLATLESGVHATIAGVALGLLTPTRPADPAGVSDVLKEAARLEDDPSPGVIRATALQAQETVSVAERLEHRLHPFTSFLIIPLFALANAGIAFGGGVITGAAGSPVTLGIVAGLVVGKLVGITGLAWLAVKAGIGTLPTGVGWRHTIGGAAVAGIGFTVSLFIAGLAFDDPQITEEAKVGIFAGSLLAAGIAAVMLMVARSPEPDETAPGGEG